MLALLSLFIVILLSITVIRVGAVALEITGLSNDVSSFQAMSAFTGVGFTTLESEKIVQNPTRRNIIKILILLGNVGITTSMAALILTFVGEHGEKNQLLIIKLLILLLGIFLIYQFVRSKIIYKFMKDYIVQFFERKNKLQIYDYQEILGLSKGFVISQINIEESSYIANKLINELNLAQEDMLILSVERKRGGKYDFIGTPNGDTAILVGDTLTCYGRSDAIKRVAKKHGTDGKSGEQQTLF